MRRCPNWKCPQRPELRQTGWGKPHTEWICWICKAEYFVDSNGELVMEEENQKGGSHEGSNNKDET